MCESVGVLLGRAQDRKFAPEIALDRHLASARCRDSVERIAAHVGTFVATLVGAGVLSLGYLQPCQVLQEMGLTEPGLALR